MTRLRTPLVPHIRRWQQFDTGRWFWVVESLGYNTSHNVIAQDWCAHMNMKEFNRCTPSSSS